MKFNPVTLQEGSAVFKQVMSSATPKSNNFSKILYKPFIRCIVIKAAQCGLRATRPSDAGFFLWVLGFDSRRLHVRLVVDEMEP
jgi:hypothetical protein